MHANCVCTCVCVCVCVCQQGYMCVCPLVWGRTRTHELGVFVRTRLYPCNCCSPACVRGVCNIPYIYIHIYMLCVSVGVRPPHLFVRSQGERKSRALSELVLSGEWTQYDSFTNEILSFDLLLLLFLRSAAMARELQCAAAASETRRRP
eukprot:GHVU01039922.1.p1 GENE.GHVU01039922.1~~GHVU01039922.1.p1  ORF type:complete len:149 (+),score=5.88 GHVU01039922.1:1118-1564(+)